MADTHVVSALKDKRARLAGELEACKLRVTALTVELGSVDNCLRIFRSDVDPAMIPAKVTLTQSQLPKGAGTRTALDILRETGQAMSCPELAACILQRFDRPLTAKALHQLVATIHGNFSRRTDGIVTFDRSSYPGKWRLTAK
jgi:hypothetical protein